MEKMKPRTLSGFMELLPAPQQQMERMMDILRKTYSLYGFTPLDTPLIEAIEYGKKSRGKPRYHFEALERKQQDV